MTIRAYILATTFAVCGLFVPQADAQGTRYLDLVYDEREIERIDDDTVYGQAVNSSGEWQDLLLDVYQPIGDGAPWRPAIVWVHGGYFKRGDKRTSYQDTIQEWARSGYVVFSIAYRLRPELPEGLTPELFLDQRLDEYIDAITDAQHDAQAAIRWVRANADAYRVDPERVAIVGHSAGGLTATAVAFNSDDPGSSNALGTSSKPNAAVAMAGGGLPVRQVRIDPGDAPILFVHGAADPVVPFAPAVLPPCTMTVVMTNVCELVVDPDQDHGTFGHAEVREFLYRWIVDRPGLREPARVTVVP